MNRERAYYRKQRKRAIQVKAHLLKKLGGNELYVGWTRGCKGRLAKGKIHCSCRMCRSKSYDSLSYSDQKKQDRACAQMEDYLKG